MTAATEEELLRAREEEMARLRAAAKNIGVDRLKDGSWFRRMVRDHVKKHAKEMTPGHWDKTYPGLDEAARARKEIQKVAWRASAAGACASLGASAGELLTIGTEGIALPVGLTAMGIAMVIEGSYTALLQIDLACDVASIYGVPFDADDVGEVATLFGLSLGVTIKAHKEEHEEDKAVAPQGMTAKLLALEDGEIATRIGRKMLEDAIVRNIIPIAGVPVSARWNYVATQRLGATVMKYVRYRRALQQSCRKLRLAHVDDPSVLVEGAWLLATVDGEAGHEEVLAIALMMDMIPPEKRKAIARDKTLGDDEEGWFASLASVPKAMHGALLDTLYMVAATDKELQMGERRFLRRVGRALGEEIEFSRIEQICRHLAEGEDLPDDFLHVHA